MFVKFTLDVAWSVLWRRIKRKHTPALRFRTNFLFFFHWTKTCGDVIIDQGQVQRWRSPPPLKPTKVNFFAMTLNNSENKTRETKPFCVHCFDTAVFWSVLHLFYSSEPAMILDCQISLKSTPLNSLAGSELAFNYLSFDACSLHQKNSIHAFSL